MARLTRHELKKDEFRSTYEEFERFAKERYKEIAAVVGIVVVVVGSAFGLKVYLGRQEAEAATELGSALKTFRAYVGTPSPASPMSGTESFKTAQERYKKALAQFSEVARKFPRTKAAAIAAYHQGVCQAQLGDQAGAIKTLEKAGGASDQEIASLARLALAGELAGSGKLREAVKIYQNLADRPTLAVPRTTALLEMADAYRASQPAQARQIYERLQKEAGPDPILAQAINQQIESLPK